jgi:hypothetical protein
MDGIAGEGCDLRACRRVPVHAELFPVRHGSNPDAWGGPRELAGAETHLPMPPLGRLRRRPGGRESGQGRGEKTLTPALSRPTGEEELVDVFVARTHAKIFQRVRIVPLSHPMGEGWGEGLERESKCDPVFPLEVS